MAVSDWIANIFQSDQTRGLSGGTAGLVALDDSNPYYNYRLRRHSADGDLVSEPGLIWYTSAYAARRGGLGMHMEGNTEGQLIGVTDVLMILSHADYSRAIQSDPEWFASATDGIREAFAELCKRDNLSLPHPSRELGVRFLCDGSGEMGGQSLGLPAGEFITGLLPNLYTGPVASSTPVVGVLVNLPGVWEGYQEVGRLYDDQILFTLGSHWLDNFSHPSLEESALYRLQRYPDGSFVHLINPDLQDRFQVTSTDQDGASVLTIATLAGEPLAYMVLAVIEAEEPTPDVAPPMMLDDEVQLSHRSAGSLYGNKTIIPDVVGERIFTLQERGALLQKVHFGAFMDGYDVYVDARGQMGTGIDDASAVFEVRRRSVDFRALVHGAQVGGQPVGVDAPVPIVGDTMIEVAGQRFDYRDLREADVEGWPYVGEIRRPASSTYMMWGDQYRLGRSRECRVTLPDEPRNDNIRWKAAVGEGATIRARSGDIPKSNFYTDSIMVASEHAEVDLKGETAVLHCMARHCYTFVRRNGALWPLYPTKSEKTPTQMSLEPGDEVLIGNCLFHVGFPPAGEAVMPAPAPRLAFTASDELVEAVQQPDIAALDQTRLDPAEIGVDAEQLPEPMMMRASRTPSLSDAPVPRRSVGPGVTSKPLAGDAFSRELVKQRQSKYYDAPTVLVDGEDLPPGLLDEAPLPAPPAAPSAAPSATPPAPPSATPPPAPSLEDAGVGRVVARAPSELLDLPPPPLVDEDEGEDWGPPPIPGGDFELTPDVPAAPLPPAPHTDDSIVEVDVEFDDDDGPLVLGMLPPPDDLEEAGEVVAVSDSNAQFELSRRMQVVQVGWMVKGQFTAGNHTGADLIIPENRIEDDQTFSPTDYFLLSVRGRKASMTIHQASEVVVDGDPAADGELDPTGKAIDIIRRDDLGDEDFVVRIALAHDKRLPDPRARLLGIDVADPLAAALFTRGLPAGTERKLALGSLTVTAVHDGDEVVLSNYLPSYKLGDGFRPFFVQRGEDKYKTAPEDGVDIRLSIGDRLVVDASVFEIVEG
ncbi:MAG: hypothetical protein ACJA00_000360 [Myxococcota bacterium]|jgi:hypothetical protein